MMRFVNISYKYHIVCALIVRFILIVYSEFHDQFSEVPYTDIDYRVFTDASRHILNGKSPYERHTYRYTPLLAFLLTPNIFIHGCYGKVLFSFVDIIVGLLIKSLVTYSRKNYVSCRDTIEKVNNLLKDKNETENALVDFKLNKRSSRRRKSAKNNLNNTEINDSKKKRYDYIPDYCMLFWLYNPMSIIITTRGNCDSLAVFFVLLTLYYLQCKKQYFIAGLIHGLAVHFRLYPIFYSLSYFMFLSKFSKFNVDGQPKNYNVFNENTIQGNINLQIAQCNQQNNLVVCDADKRRTIFKKKYLYHLVPNSNQVKLISGTIISSVILTGIFYRLYGYKFLFESYIYHLIRKDIKHNFSLFFYLHYLTAGVKNIGIWQKVLCIFPQLILILVLSIRYGLNRFTLHFSILTQTIVMVTYNSVLTSQYFIWIFGILPLILWQLEMTVSKGIMLAVIWFVAQLAWLLPAYLLEFVGQNTFLFIWLQGVSFFCANMAVLGRLMKCFMYKVD